MQLGGLSGVKDVAAGEDHSLALKGDGTVWAWGSNEFGELGTGTTTGVTTPVQVSGLGDMAAVAVGDDHSLAIKNDGTLWAWGLNNVGQLGVGSRDKCGAGAELCGLTPLVVSGIGQVSAIGAGGRHSLAVTNTAPPGAPNTGAGNAGAPNPPSAGGGGRATGWGDQVPMVPLIVLVSTTIFAGGLLFTRRRPR